MIPTIVHKAYILDNSYTSHSLLYWKLRQFGVEATTIHDNQDVQYLYESSSHTCFIFVNLDENHNDLYESLQYIENPNILLVGYSNGNKNYSYLGKLFYKILRSPFLENKIIEVLSLEESA